MEDIAKIIHDVFSYRNISANSEYKKLMDKIIDKDNRLRATLSEEQSNLYQELNTLLDEIHSDTEFELIQFVLNFISQTNNYSNKK